MNNDSTPGALGSNAQLGLVERLRDWADERYVMQRGELAALRADLREAADEIERLRAEVTRLNEPGIVYMACVAHRRMSYTMDAQIGVAPPMKRVCPVCSGKARNVIPARDEPDDVPFVF